MPLSSALSYVQGLLNGVAMPRPVPPLACSIRPPDLFTDPGIIPACYLWPADGAESRDSPVGTMPRNRGPGTPSGDKSITHQMTGWVVLAGADDGTALLFPAMIDAIAAALRTAYPMPALATDPYTGAVSQISDVGEKLSWRIIREPVPDQQNNRYVALIQIPFAEVIQA